MRQGLRARVRPIIYFRLTIVLLVVAVFTARSAPLGPVHRAWSVAHVRTGAFVIQPQFDGAGPFSEGLAAVRVGDGLTGRYGFIDKTGAIVIVPQFDFAGDFSDGLAPVRIGDWKTGKYGFIDRTGTVVIGLDFDGAGAFSEGLAAVRVGDRKSGRVGFIDRRGRMTIAPRFEAGGVSELPSFHEGLAAVRVGDGAASTFGFIDTTGAMAIAPAFDVEVAAAGGRRTVGPPSFSEGLAAVHVGGSGPGGRWIYIDRHGTPAMTPAVVWAEPFHDGLAAVQIGSGLSVKTGFMDKHGRMVIAATFDAAGPFRDGLAPMHVDGYLTGKGYLEKFGQLVAGPTFTLSDVALSGELTRWKTGFIDRTGKVVIAPEFGGAGIFSDGLAAVAVSASPMRTVGGAFLLAEDSKGKWGFIAR